MLNFIKSISIVPSACFLKVKMMLVTQIANLLFREAYELC